MSSGRSPISSRKSVPPSASSKRPWRRLTAPVNAPFSCPKSSLSIRLGGSAAQFTRTSARDRRRLRSWTARPNSSLPVPVSPSSNTAQLSGATCASRSRASRITELWPTISSKSWTVLISSLRQTLSAVNRWLSCWISAMLARSAESCRLRCSAPQMMPARSRTRSCVGAGHSRTRWRLPTTSAQTCRSPMVTGTASIDDMPLRRAYSRSASASIGRSSRRDTVTTSRFMSRQVSHRQAAGSTSTPSSSTPGRGPECDVSIVPFSLNPMIVLRSTFSARHVCSSASTSAGVRCSGSSDANRVDKLVNRRSNPNPSSPVRAR